MSRPSHKELSGKLKAAQGAVSKQSVEIVDPVSLACDALELGYLIEDELLTVLSTLLSNTTPENYAGHRPPQKSYEKVIEGLELFAFSIKSDLFNKDIYYKFSISDNIFFLSSLHEDR